MTDPWIAVLGTIVVASLSGLVAVVVARLNGKNAEEVATTAPYDSLVRRLEKVESKSDEQGRVIEMLRDRLQIVIHDRDSLVAYVKQWGAWFSAGAHPPPPVAPPHLRDLLDPDEWEVAHVTERTTTTTFVAPPHDD